MYTPDHEELPHPEPGPGEPTHNYPGMIQPLAVEAIGNEIKRNNADNPGRRMLKEREMGSIRSTFSKENKLY